MKSENNHDIESLNLKSNLIDSIRKSNLDPISAFQFDSINRILEKRDIIAVSRSLIEKTASYIIALLNMVDESLKSPQVIVLNPNAEASWNVYGMLKSLADSLNISTAIVVGGINIRSLIESILNGPQVVVGTGGRISDLIRKSIFNIEHIKLIIFHEIDKSLLVGFYETFEDIVRLLCGKCQFCMFSSTLDTYISQLADEYFRNPKEIIDK